MKACIWYFIFFMWLTALSCQAQSNGKKNNNAGKRDNPTRVSSPGATNIDVKVKTFLGDTLLNLIRQADRIEAFHLKEWATDTSTASFRGFKVLAHVPAISKVQRDTLLSLITSRSSFRFSKIGKRCEFSPNLAFRFSQGGQHVDLLIALNCDILKFLYQQSPERTEEFDTAHKRFLTLAKLVFPGAPDFNAPSASSVGNNIVAARSNESTVEHTILKTDNLALIAKKYKVQVSDLLKWNPQVKNDGDLKKVKKLVIKKQASNK